MDGSFSLILPCATDFWEARLTENVKHTDSLRLMLKKQNSTNFLAINVKQQTSPKGSAFNQ